MKSLNIILLSIKTIAGVSNNGQEISVVGGNVVSSDNYPYMVAIFLHNDLCGGTLIAPNFVLTAGHCFSYKTRPTEITVDPYYHQERPKGAPKFYSVSKLKIHEAYRNVLVGSDSKFLYIKL